MPLASRSDTSFDHRPKEDEEWVAAEEKRAEEEAARKAEEERIAAEDKRAEEEAARKAEEAQGAQREAGAARLA